MKTSQEKALKKKKVGKESKFFDELDKSLGNGKFLTKNPYIAVKPKR